MKTWRIFLMGAALSVATERTLAGGVDPGVVRRQALEVISPLPARMPGAEKDTPSQVALGRRLFFEKRLSENETQSCNTCHSVDRGLAGVDNEPTSPGAFGKRGGRNSPTVLNAGFHVAQFWDGRADSLEAQAKGPILNPIEMGMPDSTAVIARLQSDKSYVRHFARAFPEDANALNYDNLARAVAAYERTLVTKDRLDEFLRGRDRALSAQEQRGLREFITVGCTTCHNGPLVGGNGFRKFGIFAGVQPDTDKGRSEITKDEADEFVFKIPSLRNIAITGPYFHDGREADLTSAIKTMGKIQLNADLAANQVADIGAYLKAMTDRGRKARVVRAK